MVVGRVRPHTVYFFFQAEDGIRDIGVTGVPDVCSSDLKYRTSYGQSVLAHSVEVANLCGMMAQELGANVKIARRAALLHDVGKAIDHEVEGTHALIGGRFAKKSGESDDVVRAISAHHHEIEMETVEDVLVATADAVSAARPGARRETTELYLERLRSLEDIAPGHRGVDKA